jgi:uncharacterized membrane protein (DUF373 family)
MKTEPMTFIKRFERVVFYFLIITLVGYIIVELIELIYQFVRALMLADHTDGRLLMSRVQAEELLPFLFTVLIAVELIETFNVYIKEHTVKVLNILLIGLITIGRKLITFDFSHANGLTSMGLAALIISLAGGYYLIKRSEYQERLQVLKDQQKPSVTEKV